MSIRIAAFCGSARTSSLNGAVLKAAVEAAREAGAEVTEINLRDYPMPLYDGDLEAASGIPEEARALRSLLMEHQGLLLASPEYNSSVTPLMKNTIDWISRPDGELPMVAVFQGKVAGLLAASPGGGGGGRGQLHLREILQNIGVMVIPQTFTLGGAHQYVTDGVLSDAKHRGRAAKVGAGVAATLSKLYG